MAAASPAPDSLAVWVGRRGPTTPAPDAVNAAMIRHWCEVLGDTNPAYRDAGAGAPIAPPAMLQVWTMPGYGVGRRSDELTAALYAELDAQGYSSIVATNSEQEYHRALRPGERVAASRTIEAISGEKSTRLGPGIFVTSTIEFSGEDGHIVGRQLHRVLKFKPHQPEIGFRARPEETLAPRTNPALLAPAPSSAAASALSVGMAIPSLTVAISRSFIISSAIVSRDFEDIHHDCEAAKKRGAADIFTNIITTNGLISRLVTDWAGPKAELRRISVRLGGQNHPGDTLKLTGRIVEKTASPSGLALRVEICGANERGIHATGFVDIVLAS
ncbi:FAS1-like dehydratase domain-containing protein [Bosea sp. NPDC055594]